MANINCEWNEIDWIIQSAQHESARDYHRFEDWYRWHQDQLDMEKESHKVSTVFNQLGWSQHKHVKRIMSMPLHIFYLLREVDKDFARNTPEGKNKVYRFLMRHPQFSVR